ncbi:MULTISPECIES: FAD-dependent oxidoreductase [Actinoalloteichus]|uniref:2-polyprenyl-6-methoxyphenol hydroxylase-like oxidoreductase n=1 Tax=Actinoalloteichus fjordicus TaxID=1612552 RepID=A0AAC9LDC9_9PSEU|nr:MULTISPECIES: FAD-dependent oxidoreductase [Actinoalloteichus]APU15552.1 2-polyprenyl-6-methoxyphenol hydroxylase-like oxidoreductase [Actinoalloteichus fjordicus]APU21619.1 2-polyprenyl-6-methoxyphenol hydroxylase-like oxidoreductase [Actinoalloteichus sp. GBA129-24]
MAGQVGRRAVVLGGSMAGCLAARALAEHYAEVVVVERDTILGVDGPRRGAPHTRHAHGLHARGHLALEELFPGLTDELVATGVPTGDLGEMRWYFNARRLSPARTGLTSVTAPRPVLEHHVRARVAELPNVTFLERHRILGLRAATSRSRIVGVRVQSDEATAEELLDADLVVDATGRGSRTPVWLQELGYSRPDEDRVKIDLAYTTRHYRTRPEWFDGVQSINPVASPAHPRGAFFGQVGRDVCVLSLTGLLGDHPPTEPEAFLEFVRSLPIPEIYTAVREGEPLDDPVSFRFPTSVRRRYERLARFPERLLVLGDAVCSFNPVYGQGMSVAAIETLTLLDHLRLGTPPVPQRFFADVARVVDAPWDVSAGGDLDFPDAEGPRSVKTKVVNAYMARLQYAASKDAGITDAFMRVAGLVDPPQALLRPKTVLRVLRHAVRRPPPGESRSAAPQPESPRTSPAESE